MLHAHTTVVVRKLLRIILRNFAFTILINILTSFLTPTWSELPRRLKIGHVLCLPTQMTKPNKKTRPFAAELARDPLPVKWSDTNPRVGLLGCHVATCCEGRLRPDPQMIVCVDKWPKHFGSPTSRVWSTLYAKPKLCWCRRNICCRAQLASDFHVPVANHPRRRKLEWIWVFVYWIRRNPFNNLCTNT